MVERMDALGLLREEETWRMQAKYGARVVERHKRKRVEELGRKD